MNSSGTTPAGIVETTMEVPIAASADRVWKALTENIGEWWPAEFYVGGAPGTNRYELDAQPGGRMYESWEGGGGVLWGTVTAVDPGKMLHETGATFPKWGGPSLWFGSWELESSGDETLLRFTESTLGRIDDAFTGSKEKGWSFLFGSVLKAWVEGTPAPRWDAAR